MHSTVRHLRRLGIAGSAVVTIVGLGASTPAWGKPKPSPSSKPTVSAFAITPSIPGNAVSASPLVLYDTGGTVTVSAEVTNALSCTLSATQGGSFDGSLAFSCSAGEVSVVLDIPADTSKHRSVSYLFRLTASGLSTAKAKPIRVTVSKVPRPPTS